MHRYYLTQRPLSIGTFPGKPASMESFDSKQYVNDIGRPAWGWVEYSEPLTDKQVIAYELTGQPRNYEICYRKINAHKKAVICRDSFYGTWMDLQRFLYLNNYLLHSYTCDK